MAEPSRFGAVAFVLLAAGLCAVTLGYPGTPDDGDFLHWAAVLNGAGPIRGYAQIADYPPLGPLILWGATKAGADFSLPPFTCIKLAIDFFQLAAALIIRWYARSWAAAALMFLLISPFGALLGYIDAFYLPFVLAGIFALRSDRFAVANLMFAIATLIKWQPAVLFPIVLIYGVGRGRKLNVFSLLPAAVFTGMRSGPRSPAPPTIRYSAARRSIWIGSLPTGWKPRTASARIFPRLARSNSSTICRRPGTRSRAGCSGLFISAT
jgi:hypothetical protein